MTNTEMLPANKIIEKFGSQAKLARALGHKNTSTVQGWKERGFIPYRQAWAVMHAAKANRIKLKLIEFFEPEPNRKAA